MKLDRTRNASRNIIFGILLKLTQIAIPFLMRSAMKYYIGIAYLGLNSLFTSILQVLNLAELGVGNAMVYSMYKPINEDDPKTICALMRLYQLYYRIIGLVVLVAGLILTPFLPRLIKSDVPENINIYILYFLNLMATVLSYWLFAYKNSLLTAHQRIDVISKVTLATNLVQYVLQFLVLWLFHNYYLYVIMLLITQAVTNILTAVAATKMFPDYKPVGDLDKQEVKNINKRILDLFTSKVGTVILNSADTIVISAFLGLTMLAVYQNYYFILTAIIGLVTIVFNSCTAGIGNSLLVESKEKNYNDIKKFTFLIAWITSICSCCFLTLFQPFMTLWMGEAHLMPFSAVVCLVIYYFLFEINQLLNTYKDAAGIWHADRFRPLITALANLVLNLIMVQFWGIYGVMLSTVISMLVIGMPWLLHNLFTCLFDRSDLFGYVRTLFGYAVVALIACAACLGICRCIILPAVLQLLVNLVVSVVICNLIFILCFRKNPEFGQSIELIDRMTRHKLGLGRLLNKMGKNHD